MKVGLITLHRSLNNGAVLQAYALQKTIRSMGHDIEVIDYYPSAIREGHEIFKPGFAPVTLVRNFVSLLKYPTLKRLSGRFSSFLQQNLPLSTRQYSSAAELAQNPPQYDVYVCGSDQVWNPQRNADMGRPYFLSFAPQGRRRVAYAPSFGVGEISADRQSEIAAYLRAIDCLSVRETQGQAIIKQLTGRDAVLTLDPTLLLEPEEWSPVTEKLNIAEPFALVYGVMAAPLPEMVARVKKATGLKTVAIYPGLRSIPISEVDVVLSDVGPAEFLWLFQNASAAVINTFHGAAFSIINRKPFLVTPARHPSRLVSLLDILGLSDHWITDVGRVKPAQVNGLLNANITEMPAALDRYRQESLSFLKTALSPQL